MPARPYLKFEAATDPLKFPLLRNVGYPVTLLVRHKSLGDFQQRFTTALSVDPWDVNNHLMLGQYAPLGTAQTIYGSTGSASTITALGGWDMAMGSSESDVLHLMRNLAGEASKTNDFDDGPWDTLYIGAKGDATGKWSGYISDLAVYDVNLSSEEWDLYERGYSPEHIRPNHLLCYFPLAGDLVDVVSGRLAIETGTAPIWDWSETSPLLPIIRRCKRDALVPSITIQEPT